jgi:hypothetical protein
MVTTVVNSIKLKDLFFKKLWKAHLDNIAFIENLLWRKIQWTVFWNCESSYLKTLVLRS